MTISNASDAPHLLIAGDSRDIPAIRSMLARLPAGSYGQLFLEVAADSQVEHLRAPEGIAVHWLPRDAAPANTTLVAPRGERLVAAVRAWISEWIDPLAASPMPVVVWIGCATVPRVGELHVDLDALLSHRYRLAGETE